ncbi:MAG: ABC-ATPase domain-containing protein, partial [Fidelibacterota bacterium]
MLDAQHLKQTLSNINSRGYKAYNQIKGNFGFPDFELFIDHVQGDPFAQPSKIRIRVSQSIAKIPNDLWPNAIRKIVVEDF